MIIGVAGPARSGKDTVGKIIKEEFPDAKHESFAKPIKTMLMVGLGLTKEQVDGDLKEVVDERYGVTPRHMMQTLGTEWGRHMVCDDLWERALKDRVKDFDTVYLTDVRFDNEAEYVRKNGKLLHILSGSRSEVNLNHPSEAGIAPEVGDYGFFNDGTIEDLREHVRSALSDD